jgi:hypothetical protein
MKTFLQYINEDIELSNYIDKPRDMDWSSKKYTPSGGAKKLRTKPAKGFSLYAHRKGFFIVDDKTGLKVGVLDATFDRKDKEKKTFSVEMMNIHPAYTKKKLGISLAVASYKAIHKSGYTIKSGDIQSQGGASIWKALRNDKILSKNIVLREPGEGDIVGERPAKRLSDEDIYIADGRVKKKDKVKGRRDQTWNDRVSSETKEKDNDVRDSILVLHSKKSKTRLPPVVKRFKHGSTWKTKSGKIGAKNKDGDIEYFALDQLKRARGFASSLYNWMVI